MQSFAETLSNLHQAQSLVKDAAVLVYQQVVTENDSQKHINIAQLKRLPNYRAYLYQWLSALGFTAWSDIYNLTDAQPGKQVLSPGYRLLKDRDVLVLEPHKERDNEVYKIEQGQMQITKPVNLIFADVDKVLKTSGRGTIYVDAQKLKFPLFVRKWQDGDYFYPLGMNGQKKKLSKYFKDEKMSLSNKEDTWLLCSENQIVWVINYRADERFKADNKTTQTLKIELL